MLQRTLEGLGKESRDSEAAVRGPLGPSQSSKGSGRECFDIGAQSEKKPKKQYMYVYVYMYVHIHI